MRACNSGRGPIPTPEKLEQQRFLYSIAIYLTGERWTIAHNTSCLLLIA